MHACMTTFHENVEDIFEDGDGGAEDQKGEDEGANGIGYLVLRLVWLLLFLVFVWLFCGMIGCCGGCCDVVVLWYDLLLWWLL